MSRLRAIAARRAQLLGETAALRESLREQGRALRSGLALASLAVLAVRSLVGLARATRRR